MIKAPASHFKSDKIIEFRTAAKIISELKKANKTVGLCHGGFDLLHPGHIKHLESASKLCDCLFVSVTSDTFVAKRKGSGRPIFSEKLRVYSVASIEYVDYAVISNFKLATDVIKKLKPSFYIKGPDFANKMSPGITAERDKIKALGGEIKYTNDKKLSTTEIIRYIIRYVQENLKRERVLLVIDRDGTLIEDVKFLGRDNNWKDQIKLKSEVIDLISYAQSKYDTTKVVISNQSGVARGYFDTKTVKRINRRINNLLLSKGVAINNWQYCPDADSSFAVEMKRMKFNPDFVKDKTRRKPSPEMLMQALRELNKKIGDFDKIAVIGNSIDDAEMAKNVHAAFIDVNNKSYEGLRKEFESI